jgi:glucosyl-3-phosphoglycerate synthase
MSDFAQSGPVCTLQQLAETNVAKREEELAELSRSAPVAVILPCHAADLPNPAFARIVAEVQSMPFVSELVVSMNGVDTATYTKARHLCQQTRQNTRVLWNDNDAARKALRGLGITAADGKGTNVWLACGLLRAENQCAFAVTQDCDVVSFRRENIGRLCYAALHPELQYRFAKLYYSRVADRLYGRVSRLFLAPFLEAIVRVIGHQPLVEFLRSFRYPLAGECVIACAAAGALRMDCGWGFEIGLLCEAFRHLEPRQIAQVDGGRFYEHRHQALGDAQSGLFRMSKEIAHTLFANLIDEGFPVCGQLMGALRESFVREVAEALRRSRHLALMNGLRGVKDDTETAAALTGAFDAAGQEFMTATASGALPAWNEVLRSKPREAQQLFEALMPGRRGKSTGTLQLRGAKDRRERRRAGRNSDVLSGNS